MIDADFTAFVRGSLRSVWAVEQLLLMRRDPERTWTAEELVRELRASDVVVDGVLQLFQAAGLAHPDSGGRWRYAPASPALRELCDRLARIYRERPGQVVRLIVSAPNDKLQSLADAFRLKGD